MLTRIKALATALLGRYPTPVIPDNAFIVWEPCTHSHAEVLPGFVKYLLDLGYPVAVFATPERFDEGLFSRFSDSRISLNRLPQPAIRRFFRKHGLAQARGVLITTARKISGRDDYTAELALFAGRRPDQRLLLVEHDIKAVTDKGALTPQTITLRQAIYGNAVTTMVNPHWFGTVQITGKNRDCTNFITIGALRGKRRNASLLIEAVRSLHAQGVTNFRITVIGRGNLHGVPAGIRRYFHIKGRLDFTSLYAEMEQADFFLPLLDPENPQHDRYITTGTTGSFQLIYGFAKPCLIASKFAGLNGFNNINSIVHHTNDELMQAMRTAIDMTPEAYADMQRSLQSLAAGIYATSLANLRQLTTS